MKTFMPKAADITRKWYVVDAEGLALGRVASQVANILRGKNKPIYTPNVDTGDFVIVINADNASRCRGHAAQGPPGPPDGEEAEDLRRRRA